MLISFLISSFSLPVALATATDKRYQSCIYVNKLNIYLTILLNVLLEFTIAEAKMELIFTSVTTTTTCFSIPCLQFPPPQQITGVLISFILTVYPSISTFDRHKNT